MTDKKKIRFRAKFFALFRNAFKYFCARKNCKYANIPKSKPDRQSPALFYL